MEPFKGERLTVILFTPREPLRVVTPGGDRPGGVVRRTPAPVDRGADPVAVVKKSYKNVGKKERHAELFPDLQKEIAARKVELFKGVR